MNIIEKILNWFWIKKNAPYGPACGFIEEDHHYPPYKKGKCMFCNRKKRDK